MKVIDCFPFFDEFLILDIRFRELYDVVDKFYIVESVETFSGIQKPLYLSECIKERYPDYLDKIDVVVAPSVNYWDAWHREYFQKNHISRDNLKYLNLEDDDLILFSDADEIPRRSVIKDMKENGYNLEGGNLGGPTYYYKLNVLTSEISYRPKYVSYKYFTNHTSQRYSDQEIIPNAGWHFSYLKTPENIQNKIKAFSHQEFNNDIINNIKNIEEKISSVSDLFGRTEVSLNIVDIDDSFPEYVKENKEKLREWIA